MRTEIEQLSALRRDARAAEKDLAWKPAEAMKEQADELADRMNYYNRLRDEILAIPGNSREVQGLANKVMVEFTDREQQVERLIGVFKANNLITTAQYMDFRKRIYYVSPAQRKRQKEAWERNQRLDKAFDSVLQAVPKPERREALRIYNLLGDSPRSEDKINAWVRELMSAKLLGPEWLAGRQLGAALNKLLHPA